MKIYLAGKIAKNDWRHQAVRGLRDAVYYHEYPSAWPIMRQAVFGHDYVGPFFVSCDHCCYHGPGDHGAGASADDVNRNAHDPVSPGCSGLSGLEQPGDEVSIDVARKCREAIDRADAIFAWVDDPSAYGTILEIGYAIGRRKRVALAYDSKISFRRGEEEGVLAQLWLMPSLVREQGGPVFQSTDPVSAVREAIALLRGPVN